MADAASALTLGSLARAAAREDVPQPILQCLQIKAMASQTGTSDRYRVVMSDSVNYMQGMITQRTPPWVGCRGRASLTGM